ncbi:carboxylic ester hydrolase [Paenibacillus sp. JNUCC32]|uniref:alpha/beta hydrolase family protein n=1 Tax=Paenibacillus sp. JNUCC32 TaxID=2777984 RepID=UPI001788497D|nr:alpha/beta fold hydrolase [Paenibacillus sp. JNUCC-32]QOT12587.1 carboxylic ester hydrolase [Paenibacillus sp. JNUCC-32]
MRIGEMVIILFIIALAIITIWGQRSKKSPLIYSLIALFIVTVVQIIVEDCRWQMIPCYAASVILTVCIIFRKPKKKPRSKSGRRWIAGLWTTVLLLYASVMVALPLLLPVFAFHQPQGTYSVGTAVYHFIDNHRPDEYSAEPTDHRELMVQLWYPSEPETGEEAAPYIRNVTAITQGLEQALSFPAWTLSHLGLVETHAYSNAPLSTTEQEYPILIFSHGMTGFRNQNTFQIEELASHGYIVVGIDHVYDAAATVYPDGREILINKHQLSGFEALDEHMTLWTQDVSFILNRLEQMNRQDEQERFTGRLDLERIGMFGHSYGGAAAAQMLLKDSRIKAAINMDGTLYGDPMPSTGLNKPYLQMNGEKSIDKSIFDNSLDQAMAQSGHTREYYEDFWEETVRRRMNALQGGGYTMTIPHTSHMSYTDFHLFSPLLPNPGEDPESVHRIINEVSVAFFDQHLKEIRENAMNELSKKYPVIELVQD